MQIIQEIMFTFILITSLFAGDIVSTGEKELSDSKKQTKSDDSACSNTPVVINPKSDLSVSSDTASKDEKINEKSAEDNVAQENQEINEISKPRRCTLYDQRAEVCTCEVDSKNGTISSDDLCGFCSRKKLDNFVAKPLRDDISDEDEEDEGDDEEDEIDEEEGNEKKDDDDEEEIDEDEGDDEEEIDDDEKGNENKEEDDDLISKTNLSELSISKQEQEEPVNDLSVEKLI